DPAPAARAHLGQDGLCAQKDGLEIDGDGAVEIGLGDFVKAPVQGDAGVVNENVDWTKLVLDAGDHARHRGGLGQIGLDGDGLVAELVDGVYHSLSVQFVIAIVDGDAGAGLGER